MDVFLGSSKTLNQQRLAFSGLVNALADPAFDACDQDVVGRMWETESYAMERDRSKQEAYDEVIRDCDLAFILVGDHLGDYTLHEYLVAAESLAQKGSPRVAAWVSPATIDVDGTPSAPTLEPVAFADANTRTLLEHAASASNVQVFPLDTTNAMLLQMLQLMVTELGPVPLRMDGAGIWTGHKRLVSLEGVPASATDAFAAWLAHR